MMVTDRRVWQAESGQWRAGCPCGWNVAGCADEFEAHGELSVHIDDCTWLPRVYGRARREQRKQQAAERRALHNLLTPEQQLVYLDARLGRGAGATRERRRLAGVT